MELADLLQITLDKKASDLHLSVGMPPAIRVDGDLVFLDQPALLETDTLAMLKKIMSPGQLETFMQECQVDLAYSLADKARFRVNVYQQQRGVAAAFRPIPTQIPTLKALDLQPVFYEFCKRNNGLILVTGPTGSGKSTTLAAMINHINETESQHIITVEDPIEFLHTPKKCLINQREVGDQSSGFNNFLRAALREDPDIITIGELRDLETIRLALTAAETGHLVFATLHTHSAPKSIDRIIDVFPGSEKELIREMLSESLYAVVAQTLIKKANGGRVALQEIMICNNAIRNLIRENKISQIYNSMQTGRSIGMQTREQHLEELRKAGKIAAQDVSPPVE